MDSIAAATGSEFACQVSCKLCLMILQQLRFHK